jgi:hypothetical protein
MAALTPLDWALDALLALMMLWLAWRALATSALFQAVVLFIAFERLATAGSSTRSPPSCSTSAVTTRCWSWWCCCWP